MSSIIKARERHGTASLDLTLPAKIRKKYNIKKGDVFKVNINEDTGELQLIYTLIYQN